MAKTYLVTGAAGFIGSRFVQSCAERAIDLISVDQLSHFEERPEHAEIPFGTQIDREDLFDFISSQKLKLDAIIHLGACTNTFELDEAFLNRVNFEYSKKLWKFAAERGVPFVYASSAATYGAGENGYDDEETLLPKLVPLNPYGESKQRFDLWALHEEAASRTPPAWSGFKFFNVYGFGERHKTKMASVVLHSYDQIMRNGSIQLFKSHREGIADGHQARDFITVDDVVKVLHFAAEKPIQRGIFNLGSGTARTFLDLARATFRATGTPEKIDFIDTPEVLRNRYQYFTQAKMQKLRGEGYSEPFTSLEDGIQDYIRRLKKQKS